MGLRGNPVTMPRDSSASLHSAQNDTMRENAPILVMNRFLLCLAILSLITESAGAAWVLEKSDAQPAPAGLDFTERRMKSESSDATLWVVTFDPKAHAFAVM